MPLKMAFGNYAHHGLPAIIGIYRDFIRVVVRLRDTQFRERHLIRTSKKRTAAELPTGFHGMVSENCNPCMSEDLPIVAWDIYSAAWSCRPQQPSSGQFERPQVSKIRPGACVRPNSGECHRSTTGRLAAN